MEQYICNRFTIIANASRDSNSKEEMAVRFVQQKYKYSEKQSRRMVAQIAKHKEIFEEFFNYARVGRFCKKDKPQLSSILQKMQKPVKVIWMLVMRSAVTS